MRSNEFPGKDIEYYKLKKIRDPLFPHGKALGFNSKFQSSSESNFPSVNNNMR